MPQPSPYVILDASERKVCGHCGRCGDNYNNLLSKFGHWSNTFSAIEPMDKMCVAMYDYDTCHSLTKNISENNISENNISENNISENNISENNISENNISTKNNGAGVL